jgi:BASS family bile acid:Na+ symporter
MNADRWINLLVTITLVEMMFAVGLGTAPAEVAAAMKQCRLTLRAAVANYILVPAAAVALLAAFHARPMAAAGFLILAACPGAPYGPPLTAIAKGNVATAVGWMAILASSSALAAPLLLSLLLPVVSGEARLEIDAMRLAGTLVLTQLAPLGTGLALHFWRPGFAARLLPAASRISKLLNLAAIGSIVAAQHRMLLDIRWAAFAGMFALLLASLLCGWLLGGPDRQLRRTLAITTSLRNAGAGMVIAASSFPGTPALTAVLAYAIVGIFGSLAIAAWWGRSGDPTIAHEANRAAGSASSSPSATRTAAEKTRR